MKGDAANPTVPGPFSLPPVAVARHPDVLLTVRAVRGWLDGLPLANPPRAAQMLLQQLRLLVRDPNPGARLPQLLDVYGAPQQQLLNIAQERTLNSPDNAIPLDQFEYQLVDLMTELAYGHLRVANTALAAGKPPGAGTLYRALRLLDAAITIERLHYHRLGADNWRLVLGIFLHAEEQQLGGQQLGPAMPGDGDPDSIRGLFFRALIISLCDPHSHRPSEVLSWVHWIGGQLQNVELTVLPQGAFAVPVDISGIRPPLASARRGKPGPDTRYLVLDDLLQRLKDDTTAPDGLRSALNAVLKGRKTREQRQAARQPRNHPYRLLTGLNEIHRRLSELTRGGDAGSAAGFPCLQLNQSSSGAAFQLDGASAPALGVGEPVLAEAEARSPGGAPVGFAARIQRLVSDDDRLDIGVEKLLGRLTPVTLGGAAERRQGDRLGLLLQDADTGRYTLLVSRSVYRERDTVSVEGPNLRYSLRMLSLEARAQQIAYVAVETVD